MKEKKTKKGKMKGFLTVLPFLLGMMLALTGGLLAPQIAFRIADRRVESRNRSGETWNEEDQHEYAIDLSFAEKLEITRDGNYIGPFKGIGKMKEEEVLTKAFEEWTLKPLESLLSMRYGPVSGPEALENMQIEQAESYYLQMEDPERGYLTMVVWKCAAYDSRGNEVFLLIDDEDQVLLAYDMVFGDMDYAALDQKDIRNYAARIEKWYGADEIEATLIDRYFNIRSYILTFRWENGENERTELICNLSVGCSEDEMLQQVEFNDYMR